MQETTNYQSPLTKEKILIEYKDVFEGLGHIGDASTFVVHPNQSPVQHTPRRIAVALRSGLAAKPEKIRICLDPHDLNKALLRPKYQMPTFEQILPSLKCEIVYNTRSKRQILSDWS